MKILFDGRQVVSKSGRRGITYNWEGIQQRAPMVGRRTMETAVFPDIRDCTYSKELKGEA